MVSPANSSNMNQPMPEPSRLRPVIWLALVVWAIACWFIGDKLSYDHKYRINDLESIPGAGTIQRDAEGTFYHVRGDKMARSIFQVTDSGEVEVGPPVYAQPCYDCRLVSGEQLAATNDFCATGRRSRLPLIDFEAPCKTWATIDSGRKVMAAVVFFVPLLLLVLIRWIAAGVFKRP